MATIQLHYGNLNCVFTRVDASMSNKYNFIDSLATLNHGLSFNINSDSFNFKWELFEALPIKVKQEESAWWLFWWQCFLMVVASLPLYFDGFSVRVDFPKCFGVPEGGVLFRQSKHHCRCCTWICKLLLSLTESDVLRVINNLSKNRLMQLWMKTSGKELLTLNIEIHCETYCNQHTYWMLGIEECELSLSCTLNVKNCYSSYKHH